MRVVLYTREGCRLCDEVRDELAKLQGEYPHELSEVDIESDDALVARYGESIPVVQAGPYTLRAPIASTDLRVTLAAATAGDRPAPEVSPGVRKAARGVNRAILQVARHWLLLFNMAVFLFVSIPFLAPVLLRAGASTPADVIYRVYSPLCHQLAFRSWFLFGEQPAYPRELAGLPGVTYENETGLPPDDYLAAKRFVGGNGTGYKVAMCQRDIGIYGGILVAGLLFGLVRHRLRAPSMLLWIMIGIVPMALDGGSQLVSNIPFFPFEARESTPLLRTITGALFGVMCVWLAYPYVEESMSDARAELVTKLEGKRSRPPSADGDGVVD
jgi:uncharacterized membrane protein